MKPTSKQIDFIKDICEVLGLKEPTCETIQEASSWIQEHLDDYNSAVKDNEHYEWASSLDYDDLDYYGITEGADYY